MKKYLRTWLFLALNATLVAFTSRFGAVLLFLGKVLRFFFFLFFFVFLVERTKTLGNYNLWQVVFFYLTFNFIDTLSQFLFREVYRFRYQVVSGNFDFILTKPFNPLFRVIFGGADILDLVILLPLLFGVFFTASKLGVSITLFNVLTYIVLSFVGFLIALSFHIFVASLAILTTEIDNTIMLYRDLTSMARIPVDIYREPVRALLTFVIPVAVMMTFPAKALMGLLSLPFIFYSIAICSVFLFLSLKFWGFALRQYSSASS